MPNLTAPCDRGIALPPGRESITGPDGGFSDSDFLRLVSTCAATPLNLAGIVGTTELLHSGAGEVAAGVPRAGYLSFWGLWAKGRARGAKLG